MILFGEPFLERVRIFDDICTHKAVYHQCTLQRLQLASFKWAYHCLTWSSGPACLVDQCV
jgi:hypothetical protein